MLNELNLKLRAKRRAVRSMQEKHMNYMFSGFEGCFYVNKSLEKLIAEEEKINKYIDLVVKLRRMSDIKINLSYDNKIKLDRFKNKFKLNYLENIFKFFSLMRRLKKFQKKNFNINNKVSLKELYTPEAIDTMDKFFKEKYNISLKEIENDISIYKVSFDSLYNEVKAPFAAAYFAGGKFKKSVMITDYSFQGKTALDKGIYNSELLVHELTHYLQFTKGYAKSLDMIKASLANIHLMITGSTKYYMKDKLEADARFNQEDYKHFIENGELKRKTVLKDLFESFCSGYSLSGKEPK